MCVCIENIGVYQLEQNICVCVGNKKECLVEHCLFTCVSCVFLFFIKTLIYYSMVWFFVKRNHSV